MFLRMHGSNQDLCRTIYFLGLPWTGQDTKRLFNGVHWCMTLKACLLVTLLKLGKEE
uniref:Uncharacterized protein n=1 Tax=Arundo donax TaxID=35708 RepID=A0A0A8Z140_ARUDO